MLEIKYSIISIYYKYKDAPSLIYFFILFIFSFIVSILYICYFVCLFFIIFLLILIQSLIYSYIYKKDYTIKHIIGYNYDFKNDILRIIKYYFYTNIVRHSFAFLYVLIKIINESNYYILITTIASRTFIFIYIFGFPTIVFQFINKIYARINNSIFSNRLNFKIKFK